MTSLKFIKEKLLTLHMGEQNQTNGIKRGITSQQLIGIGILLCIIGVVVSFAWYIVYRSAINRYGACMRDCFMSCSWCSFEQLDEIHDLIDFFNKTWLAWVAAGVGTAIAGLYCCVRGKRESKASAEIKE